MRSEAARYWTPQQEIGERARMMAAAQQEIDEKARMMVKAQQEIDTAARGHVEFTRRGRGA